MYTTVQSFGVSDLKKIIKWINTFIQQGQKVKSDSEGIYNFIKVFYFK